MEKIKESLQAVDRVQKQQSFLLYSGCLMNIYPHYQTSRHGKRDDNEGIVV